MQTQDEPPASPEMTVGQSVRAAQPEEVKSDSGRLSDALSTQVQAQEAALAPELAKQDLNDPAVAEKVSSEMTKLAQALGAKLSISERPEEGTRTSFTIKLDLPTEARRSSAVERKPRKRSSGAKADRQTSATGEGKHDRLDNKLEPPTADTPRVSTGAADGKHDGKPAGAPGISRPKSALQRTTTFTQADYANVPAVVKSEANILLSALIIFACIAGFVAIWVILNDVSSTMLGEVGEKITHTINGRMDFVVHSFLDWPIYVSGMMVALQREGEFDTTLVDGQSTKLNRLFLEFANSFDVTAVYVGMAQGECLYAVPGKPNLIGVRGAGPTNDVNYTEYNVSNVTSGEFDSMSHSWQGIYDPTTRPWYITAATNRAPGWVPPYLYQNGNVGTTYFQPLFALNGTLIGVLAVDVVLNTLKQRISHIANPEGGAGFVFDLAQKNLSKTPFVIGVGEYTDTSLSLEIVREIQFQNAPKSGSRHKDGVIISYTSMSYLVGLDWLLVFAIPDEVFLGEVYDLNLSSIVLAIISLVGLAGALGFLTRVAPKVAQARIYRAQIVEKYRKIDGLVQFDNGRIGPPPEANPVRERLRLLSFEVDDDHDGNIDAYRINRENCFNGEYVIKKCKLVNNNNKLLTLLAAAMFLLFGCMALMWMSWTFIYSDRVEVFYDILIDQVTQKAFTETIAFLSFPGILLQVLTQKYERGTLPLEYVNVSTAEIYDRFTYDMMQTFVVPGQVNSWLVDFIYWADERDGHYQGCQVYEVVGAPRTNWTLRPSARDPTTDPGYVIRGQKDFSPPCAVYFHAMPDGTRDYNDTHPLFEQSCTYDPRTRPWYNKARDTRKTGWTLPYAFDSGDLGMTAYHPVNNTDGTLRGVLAIDARLSIVSSTLSGLTDKYTKIFVTSIPDEGADAGWMVASSVKGELQTEDVDGSRIRLQALRAPDLSERAAAEFVLLDAYDGGTKLDHIPDTPEVITKLDRLITDPFTAATYVTDQTGMRLLGFTLVEKSIYVNQLTRYNSFTILFALGVIVLTYSFLVHGYESLRESVEFKREEEEEEQEDVLATPEPPLKDLADVMDLIAELVKTAAQKPSIEDVETWVNTNPETLEIQNKRMVTQALFFLDCAARGQNVLMVCELKLQGKYWMFQILDNAAYRLAFQVILLIHQCLSFWEPPTPQAMQAEGSADWVLALEFFILLFEISNCVMRTLINHRYLRNSAVGKTNVRINKILNSNTIALSDAIYAVVLGLTVLDWILTVAARTSFEYYFPCRPFLLLTCNAASFEALRSFVIAIYKAKSVFLLMWNLFMISAVFSFTFFRGVVNHESFSNNFESFFSSLLVMMAFVTTADNYSDLAGASMDAGGLAMIFYWVVWTFVGTFFMIAMFLSIFQTRFASVREKDLADGVVRNRFSLCAAFLLIDMDDSKEVDVEEFSNFAICLDEQTNQPSFFVKVLQTLFFFCGSTESRVVRGTGAVKQQDINKLQRDSDADADSNVEVVAQGTEEGGKKQMPADLEDFFDRLNADGGGTLDIKEFVMGVEDLFELMKRKGSNKKIGGYLWRDLLESRRLATVRLALLILQLWMISFYGLVSSDGQLDYLLTLLLFIYIAEVCLVVWVYGFDEFWFYSKFHADVHFVGFYHRMELIVMLLTLIVWVILLITSQSFPDPPPFFSFNTDETKNFRIAFALPALRLLGLIPETRQLVNALLTVLPRFIPLLYLLLVFFFIYAVIGVTIMRGKFDALGDQLGVNFNSLSDAMVALFMLLTGNNLVDTSFAAVQACGWHVIWYFLSFIGFITICFTNLFLGVLLDAFSMFLESEEKAQETAREQRRAGFSKQECDFNLTLARERTLRSF